MNETMEEIAERVAREHIGSASYHDAARKLLKDDVLSALRNERERCATVALSAAPMQPDHWNVDASHFAGIIAKAIREGK